MTRLDTLKPPVVSSAEPSSGEGKALLTYRRAARRLGVSERTLWGLVKRGQLPAVKFGGVVRIDPVDLDRFIEKAKAGQQTPGAKALAAALAKLSPAQREKLEKRIADNQQLKSG